MANEPEIVRLKPDAPANAPEPEVVRLSADSPRVRPERAPGRPPEPPPENPTRLEVPASHESFEKRSHQPGVEVLIENADALGKPIEEGWGQDGAAKPPIPWGWFALGGLIAAVAGIWAMIHLRQSEPVVEQTRAKSFAVLEEKERDTAEAEDLVDRIGRAATAYCNAGSWEELAPKARQSERVRPLMKDWYARHPFQRGSFRGVTTFQPLTLEDTGTFWVVGAKQDGGGIRTLLMEEMPDGQVLVDWETDVCYQPLDWDAFATERPTGTRNFRVHVEPDHFFSHEFANSDRWKCFRLTTRGAEQVVFGYAAADLPEARELEELYLRNGRRPVALILQLDLPPGLNSPKGVVISKIASRHWLYVKPPEGGS